jgi:hypothetical protein
LTCTPSKPVADPIETIQVRAWAPGRMWKFQWKAEAGEVTANGFNAIWDLDEVSPGPRTITVTASTASGTTHTCTVRIWVELGVRTRGDRLTRRFLILPEQPEPPDYGLYSYLLLTPDAGDANARKRNLAAVDAWLNRLLVASAQERNNSMSELNATFVPVKAEPPGDPDGGWILENYDFNRADEILAALKTKRTGGPYMISATGPVKKQKPDRFLWLDASWAPPSTIPLWLNAFVNQASQEQFSQPIAFERFNLHLRTIISVFAEEMPRAAGSIIAVIR